MTALKNDMAKETCAQCKKLLDDRKEQCPWLSKDGDYCEELKLYDLSLTMIIGRVAIMSGKLNTSKEETNEG